MTFDDEWALCYIPKKMQIGLSINEDRIFNISRTGEEDSSLAELCIELEKYFKNNILERYNQISIREERGVLIEVPSKDRDQKYDYYLHIIGEYKWLESPLTPLRELRNYIMKQTKSPKFYIGDVARKHGLGWDRIEVDFA